MTILKKAAYVGDLRDGKWQAFYQDGKLKYEGNYIQGNPDGLHKFYYNNGKIKEEQYYIIGISREKNWKKYDENGELILTITYKDNKETRINGEKMNFEKKNIKLITMNFTVMSEDINIHEFSVTDEEKEIDRQLRPQSFE